MSDKTEEQTPEPEKQAFLNIWIDVEGGLGFSGNSNSTTQLLGMVKLAEQMIIQRALRGSEDADV